MDPVTKQMLFGLGGQGGFIPGAMRAAERTFYDEQGNPIVIPHEVSGFTPDQLAAMEQTRQTTGIQDPYLTESEQFLKRTTGAYDDPTMTSKFFDPYEEDVVQQTIRDLRKSGAQQDIGQTAYDISRGGMSAFGERAGKFAGERAAGRERGMMEAVAGIRSRGLGQARALGTSEFARRNQALRQAAAGISGLGGLRQQAGAFDIGQLMGSGSLQQSLAQRQADAIRAGKVQAQMTPLTQYQSLMPFMSMAPAGVSQRQTQFTPRPSALHAGLGVGLSALGGIGSFLNPKTT
jgi:hypothetical protein